MSLGDVLKQEIYRTQAAQLLIALDHPDEYEFDIANAKETLTLARDQYYNGDGQSFLSDEDYDRLERAVLARAPEVEKEIVKGSMERGGKQKLPYFMPGLIQMHQGGDVEDWLSQYHLRSKRVAITDKLDGTSALIVYDKNGDLQIAFSRGDDEQGSDITRHISKIKNCPQRVQTPNLVVRAECVMSQESFEFLRDQIGITTRAGLPYKTARNMVAGCMNAKKNPEVVYEHIKVVAYSVLNTDKLFATQNKSYLINDLLYNVNHFTVAPCTVVKGSIINDTYLEAEIKARLERSAFGLDGIVVEIEDGKERAGLIDGSADEPEYARKFKLSGDEINTGISECTFVEWRLTKDKVLQPRPHYKPVMIGGVECTHATGYNAKFILDNNIGPGAILKIERCGDVVPNIRGVIKGAMEPQWPSKEEFGEMDWIVNRGGERGVDLVALDADEHESVILRNLIHCFGTSLQVPFLKSGNLKKLMDAGYNTPEDIICLSCDEFERVLGSNGIKAFEELPKKLHPVSLPLLAKASTIFGRGIGERKLKKVYSQYGKLHGLTMNELVSVESIEEATARKIYDNMDEFHKWYTGLEKSGYITIEKTIKKGSSMKDQIVVFTGFRDTALQKAVEQNGGTMGSSVSSKTTILVAKSPNSSSSKMTKARELQSKTGLQILGIDEFKSLLGS